MRIKIDYKEVKMKKINLILIGMILMSMLPLVMAQEVIEEDIVSTTIDNLIDYLLNPTLNNFIPFINSLSEMSNRIRYLESRNKYLEEHKPKCWMKGGDRVEVEVIVEVPVYDCHMEDFEEYFGEECTEGDKQCNVCDNSGDGKVDTTDWPEIRDR